MNAVSICAVCSQLKMAVELGPVVRAKVPRRPIYAHELRQHLYHAAGTNPSRHVDREAFARELVDHGQALQRPAIGARVEHEIVRPDVIDRRRGERSRSTVRHAPARSFLGHLEALLAPQAIHPIGPEHVACALEKDPNRAIAVARILSGQRAEGGQHGRIACDQPRHIPVRRPRHRE
jgi:hypothetical protein